MKFSAAFLLAVLPLFTAVAAQGNNRNGGFGGFGGNNNNNNNNQQNNQNNNNNNNGQNNGQNAQNNTANAGANNGGGNVDAQDSLTLDPAVIATGFESDGQETPTAGQVASLTSKNNFINFCLTQAGKPITNGQQITTGSCNPAPMGVIAATTNMPSSKFTFPANGQTIAPNQDFTISMALNNLEAGNFVNAQANYYAAPQQVNGQGNIIGHTHFVVETLQALDQTTPLDNTKFAFFKGVNTAQVNGVVSVDVAGGLPAGVYRLASINAAANHQPVLVAVAQHGSLDDMVYFTISDNAGADAGAGAGGADAGAGGAASNSTGNAAGGANGGTGAATATAAASSSSAAANNNNNGNNRGQGNNGQRQGQNGGNNNRNGGRNGGRNRFRRARIARED